MTIERFQYFISFLLKGIIPLLLVILLWHQIVYRPDIDILYLEFTDRFKKANIHWLWSVYALLPINWGLECLKWRYLMQTKTSVTWSETFKSVLVGVTLASVTPGRIGEYAGKALFVKEEDKWLSVSASLVSSIAQLFCIIGLGSISGIYLFSTIAKVEPYLIWSLGFLGFAFFLLFGFFFLHLSELSSFWLRLIKNGRIKNYLKRFESVLDFAPITLRNLTWLSLARIFVYTFQFVCLLRFFGVDISLFSMIMVIWSVYLLQSGLPLPPISGLLARGQFAVWLFGFYSINPVTVMATIFGIWLINLVIPALIGLVILVVSKWRWK